MKNSTKTPQRLFGYEEVASEAPSIGAPFGTKEYAEVLSTLLEEIGSKEFYNGSVVTLHEGFYSKLTATLIIYHSKEHESRVRDFVPVWWEMATFAQTPAKEPPRELSNDFSFHALRGLHLLQ